MVAVVVVVAVVDSGSGSGGGSGGGVLPRESKLEDAQLTAKCRTIACRRAYRQGLVRRG